MAVYEWQASPREVVDQLLFAGEGISVPSHGAYITGQQAAQKALAAL